MACKDPEGREEHLHQFDQYGKQIVSVDSVERKITRDMDI